MGYVGEHLNAVERLVHRTTLHPIIFRTGGVVLILSILLLANADTRGAAGFFLVVAIVVLLITAIRYATSEFAMTTSRVIIKVGWLSRRTTELQLAKVEGLSVEQGLLGRAMNYGTLLVGGTGGTKECFKFVLAPILLRNQIQQQIQAQTGLASSALPSSAVPAADPNRERSERECPSCAELILSKATRGRFCGQPVTPLT